MTESLKEYTLNHWQDFSDLLRFKTIAAQDIGIAETSAVSYTHLTLPTNREV